MSFTAEVKDELSRVRATDELCDYAQLSALVRVCGTLSFRGAGRYSIRITTETGSVASMIIKLTRKLFGLENRLTPRRSVLHKKRNYLIEMPEQEGLEEALVRLGILATGQGLVSGIVPALVSTPSARAAYLRGAFMAGGFIANPYGDFHLEIAVSGEPLARGIVELVGELGITTRLNSRRGSYAIYIKSYEDIVTLLRAMGAERSAAAVEAVRDIKSKKNIVNRQTNADMANSARASDAGIRQRALIDEAEELIGLDALPEAVRRFCIVRRDNPELSLAELGEELTPRVSKSAMYHRLLRLEALVEEARLQKRGGQSAPHRVD